MSCFAKVIDGIVRQVIVADQDYINSGAAGDPANWIETAYDGSFRNKYAGGGDLYLAEQDIFVERKPYPSWVLKGFDIMGLDENYNISVISTRYGWGAPVDFPTAQPVVGYGWAWDEDSVNWIQMKQPTTT